MFQTYREVSSCAPSQCQDVYIFAVAPLASRALAAITSADELLVLARDNLEHAAVARLQDVPKGPTSLVTTDAGSTAICAGTDGVVAIFDIRLQSRAAQFSTGAINSTPTTFRDWR